MMLLAVPPIVRGGSNFSLCVFLGVGGRAIIVKNAHIIICSLNPVSPVDEHSTVASNWTLPPTNSYGVGKWGYILRKHLI